MVHKNLRPLLLEISLMLQKGAIEMVPLHQRGKGFYSRFFLVRKKEKKWRPILDLRSLSKFLKKQLFHMITIQEVLQLLNAGDYMVSLDLQDAYFHIPIHRNHKKFLRFAVQGRHYQFRVLPFGLKSASAPCIFTKCLSPVAAYLGQ